MLSASNASTWRAWPGRWGTYLPLWRKEDCHCPTLEGIHVMGRAAIRGPGPSYPYPGLDGEGTDNSSTKCDFHTDTVPDLETGHQSSTPAVEMEQP